MINTATDYKKILNTILDFGELMVSVGAEINRVEDTLTRLGLSYGAKRMNVFAVTNNIIVTNSLSPLTFEILDNNLNKVSDKNNVNITYLIRLVY